MTRVITKIGDVFSVAIDAKTKKYFQWVANDSKQLGSNVIRVFKKRYSTTDKIDLAEVIEEEVEFYVHCFLKAGLKLGCWQKEGNVKQVGSVDVFFKDTDDYGHKLGEQPIKTSYNWFVWKINEEKIDVGKLEGSLQQAEIGMVMAPYMIVNRIKTGDYGLINYPGY